jgi:hypothetical protein
MSFFEGLARKTGFQGSSGLYGWMRECGVGVTPVFRLGHAATKCVEVPECGFRKRCSDWLSLEKAIHGVFPLG